MGSISCCKLCASWRLLTHLVAQNQHTTASIQILFFHVNMRYQLAQWFNLVEASDRYLDDQSIQLTSEACES